MNKLLTVVAIVLMGTMKMNAQEICIFNPNNSLNLDSEYGTALTAGTILGETSSIVAKVGADDTYKPQSAIFSVNGIEITGGLQGAMNPKDEDGGTPATTLNQPTIGAFLQFEAKANGFLYVMHKAASNKAYTVFKEGAPISYTFSAIGDASTPLGSVYCFTLPYKQFGSNMSIDWAEREFLKTTHPNIYAANWKEKTAEDGTTKKIWDPAYKVNGLGVLKFPVSAGCKYIVNANGTKIIAAGFAFNTEDNLTISADGINLIETGNSPVTYSLSGDLNGDDQVDAADIVELVNYLHGKASSYFNAIKADVNEDGLVDEKDIESLVSIIIPGAVINHNSPDNTSDITEGSNAFQIVTEAISNNAIGTIKLFEESHINGLASYFGTNEAGIEQFPYPGIDFNVGGNRFAEYLENKDLPSNGLVGFDESEYIIGGAGNAGKIFFSVDSQDNNSFDISKYSISLIDGKGNTSPITLSNVKKSSANLTWVNDRRLYEDVGAANNNGLYVADATVKVRDIDPSNFNIEKFINFERLKSDIRNLVDDIRNNESENRNNKATFKTFVNALCSSVYNLYKNALTLENIESYVSYSPQRIAILRKENGVTQKEGQSDIDIFATAVKPLSYNTFWEYENNKKDNWIIESILERAISSLSSKIRESWGDNEISAEVVSLNESDKSVSVKINSNDEIDIVVNADDWNILKYIVDVSGNLKVVNEKLAILLKTYTLGSAAGMAEKRINDYLTGDSGNITTLFYGHPFTYAVAPIVIFETNTGIDCLCNGMFVNSGIMHSYLTSHTMELIVPAYKKYVALEKSNTLLQSFVLSGNDKSFDFKLTEPGDYTIILSCVDYFGYTVTKKYNIHVIE